MSILRILSYSFALIIIIIIISSYSSQYDNSHSQGQAMAWVTPLGLPVMQPYRKTATHTVRTILQSITLSLDDDALPVSKQKQRSAFPPNFVHSLDATHMLMTTLKMKEKKITFAAVHDSYWTHANDIPAMNKVRTTACTNISTDELK